ncbi:alpha-1,3-mannosyl-glycoprotein 4-beta-N-acetylglucosaminyltransferase-like protein MGAT4E [Artibeus jamaicensis]|uniref:alpha-1,3-mannosyl-glycoprotein 4-beta-N-acetylglucosaminyltransferase-like protein MGAT4E n=1 Tax=Artibeus jamaicensis TaxID=9417 RepID=UPI00235AEA78|nr:alpha-1,3-mannosyl-glycoprotein 4-beta-N-acetylglucosaminyltransferase-like protein MGAT4E [Artibeus jamaicensis]
MSSPGSMRCSIRHGLLTLVALGLLWLFITLKVSREIEDDPVMSIKGQDSGGRRKDPRPREDWQNLTFQYMKKVQQRRKRWLTVGISSVPGPGRSGLLHTLVSLFRASSRAEQRRLTVLVHLADSDPARLRKTTAQISTLFSPQILAGQLVLIHAPPDAYPVGDPEDQAYRGDTCSKQNVDHAFLVSFAAGLSDYFLLLEDDAFCAPNFITHIRRRLGSMSRTPWVLMELSNLGLLGKLLHGRDLPLLAHFLLLFHKEKPLDQLLPHFRSLLAQKHAVLSRPFLFYRRGSHYGAGNSHVAGALRNRAPRGPHNPPGAVFTDMKVLGVHFPWQAYTLDESFFWTHNVSAGSHLTVILNHPASLRRVQVLTGTVVDGKHALQKGRVELGYEPEGTPQFCTSFAVLGPLLEGQLDQEIVPRSVGHDVSCVRLVVNARQAGGLIIRHIYLWEERAEGVQRQPGRALATMSATKEKRREESSQDVCECSSLASATLSAKPAQLPLGFVYCTVSSMHCPNSEDVGRVRE